MLYWIGWAVVLLAGIGLAAWGLFCCWFVGLWSGRIEWFFLIMVVIGLGLLLVAWTYCPFVLAVYPALGGVDVVVRY